MKQCDQIQENLLNGIQAIDLSYLDSESKEHIKVCKECHELAEISVDIESLFSRVWRTEVPNHLMESTLQLVHREVEMEGLSSAKLSIRKILSTVPSLKAFLAGMGLSLFVVFLLIQRSLLERISPAELLISGILLGGFLVLGFDFIVSHRRLNVFNLEKMAVVGLFALLLSAIGNYLCSDQSIYSLWMNSTPSMFIAGKFGNFASQTLFAFSHALIPITASSIVFGKSLYGYKTEEAVITGCISFMFFAPGLYLQCASLTIHTSGLVISWMGGALAGAIVGSIGGIKLYRTAIR